MRVWRKTMKRITPLKRMTLLLAVLGIIGFLQFAAAASANPSVTIDLTAQNISFDTKRIQVPAGASVTIQFTNRDNGIPHNFAVYESSTAKKSIFKGKKITGPDTITYTFTAPVKPGNYFFRCDVHPSKMTGTFVVQ
jgi:plastocyanin